MRIGAGLDGRLGLSLDELRDMAKVAARLGFESVWTPAGGVPDAFHICAEWSRATAEVVPGGLRTGTSVVPAVRMWTVHALAAQAATVASISGGRFVLGVGTGGYGDAFWAERGLPPKPIAAMRDYVSLLRRLLAGETVTHQSDFARLNGVGLGADVVPAEVGLAALGPQMLRVAGAHADVALLNWATPAQIAWSREVVAGAATAAGRRPDEVSIHMYVRVCIDDDVEQARAAFGAQVLSYAMGRGGPPAGYRAHFGRMGFEEELLELEARRDAGTPLAELVRLAPDEMLQAVGYYGPEAGAAARFAELSTGLDETVVRVITARPGVEPVLRTLSALTPARIRAAAAPAS